MQDNPCLAEALKYATHPQRPLYVFPCPPGDKKSYYSKKFDPDDKRWGATNDPDRIKRYWKQKPDANVCIVTGDINGLFVLETDTAAHGKDGAAELKKLIAAHGGEWPATLTARSPSGSEHYYFTWPDDDVDIRNSDSKLAPGIDVRGTGGMVVAPPSFNPKYDGYYEWISPKEQGIVNAPDWLIRLIAQKPVERKVGEPQADIKKIEYAMELIPNDKSNMEWEVADYKTGEVNTRTAWEGYNTIMMALFRATGGSDAGYSIADKWSRKNKHKHNEKYTRHTWYRRYRTSPPKSVGAGTLFTIAETYSPGWQKQWDYEHDAKDWFGDDHQPEPQHEDNIETPPNTEYTTNDTEPPKQKTHKTPKDNPLPLALALATKLWGKPTHLGKNNAQFGDDDATKKTLNIIKGDWFDFESNSGGSFRDLMKLVQARTNSASQPATLPIQWHGDAKPEPPRWSIRERLPETGKGLLVGQWGTYKTFAALDISAHVMLGWNWTGEPVYRQCGVLAIAKEGAASIPIRLAAVVENIITPRLRDEPQHTIDSRRLPFVWTDRCPILLNGDDPLPVLINTAKLVHQKFMDQYNLPLGLIWIDTVSSAGGFDDENSNAEAAKIMEVLGQLSIAAHAVVIGIDHLGKNTDAGTRGGSAKEANADFVLALLGDKDLAGNVKDARLALRKLREGPTGKEIPFAPKVVDMGKDEHGYPVTSIVLDWNVTRTSNGKARSGSVQILDKALANIIALEGVMVTPAHETEQVKAIDRKRLAENFKALYDPNNKKKDSAKREAFRHALKDAEDHITEQTINGVDYVWPFEPISF